MPRHPAVEVVDPTDSCFQRLASVNDACRRYGLSRGRLYLLARENPRMLRRLFDATVVDLAVTDEVIDALPLASEKPSRRSHGLKHQPSYPASETA
jgi:hypothetical protein